MKMFRLRYWTAVILVVVIASGAASGVDEKRTVGSQVSFRPDKLLPPPISSFIWKHRNSDGTVVKAIEWDSEDGTVIPNPRFKDITTLDDKTGQITITKLRVEHTGVYTIDINSKEQEQRFTLTVKEPVPKPEIKTEKSDNPNVVYLRCEYSEPIIWKNSTEHILTGSPILPKGESLTVKKNGYPGNFYTCTLDNGASKETSDPVYERALFEDKSNQGIGPGGIVGIVILVIGGVLGIIGAVLYKLSKNFKELVDGLFLRMQGKKKNQAVPPKNNGTESGAEEVTLFNTEEHNGKGENATETRDEITSASVKEEKHEKMTE